MASATAGQQSLSQDDVDLHFMRFAIAQANLCTPTASAYSVGAVLVQHTDPPSTTTTSLLPPTAPLTERIGELYRLAATGYSRELGDKTHAEEVALLKYNQLTSSDTAALPHAFPPLTGRFTLYTTMEPCSERLSGRTACTTHVLVAHVQRVVVGVEEPKVFIGNCQGMKMLKEAGVEVRRLEGFETECLAMNQHLLAGKTQ